MNRHLCKKMVFCLQCSVKRFAQSYDTHLLGFNVCDNKRQLLSHMTSGSFYQSCYGRMVHIGDVRCRSTALQTFGRSISNETDGGATYLREKKLEESIRKSYSRNKRYTSREDEEKEDVKSRKEDRYDEGDTFGTLSPQKFFEVSDTSLSSVDLEEDEEDRDWLKLRRRQNTPYWYANQMKKLVKDGKLAEGIDFLETRMLKEDNVQPIEYNYDVLIGACGRAGYTKKAFQLYNRMKERNLHPSNVTYTSLFNACAESPWPTTDGYVRLKKLHQYLLDKEVKLNLITHRAMIKAYGKCGDIEGAFHLFHHLLSSGMADARSFATILTACASHKDAGFTYAIEAWRQMVVRGLQPDDYCFNLLLRIVRDCGIGDPKTASRVLLKPVVVSDTHLIDRTRNNKGRRGTGRTDVGTAGGEDLKREGEMNKREEMMELHPASIKDVSQVGMQAISKWATGVDGAKDYGSQDVSNSDNRERDGSESGLDTDSKWWQESYRSPSMSKVAMREEAYSKDLEIVHSIAVSHLPNLLDTHADLKHVDSLANIQTAPDRLSLVGNMEGVMNQMTKCKVKPNVKTLSLLLDVVPMTTEEENKIMAIINELGVSVDVDFYNMVIHRRTKRGDLVQAKEILPMIHQSGLHPNLRTFANLAIECTKMDDGLQLLKDLEGFGLRPNQVLYGALMNAAFKVRNFDYLHRLMQNMKDENVKPNERIISLLHSAAYFGSRAPKPKPHVQKRVNLFRSRYFQWLSEMEAVEEQHPWKEYNIKTKTTEEDVESEKTSLL
ncbi:pentatricopeptide repeat-containing protein 1, mitochondrial-like isoform X2 [Apostichopus japonicus]|uniref:pentatricopeptide repeat-containing protein 1, mitochondrial-like isoform X2 n=1 Tax=Stichopus japonicus TaxID=307972 RepID=UPI003AB4CD19